MTLKNQFICCVTSCLLSFNLHASPQVPDFIIFRGDTIVTYNLLVESYLQQNKASNSGELFGLSFREGASTNCWRGYQAIYEIKNDSLFVVNIIGCGELRQGHIDVSSSLQKMKVIFGDAVKNQKVHVNWFSGKLNFPIDNKLIRWDGVFYSIYEKETVVDVTNGRLVSIDQVINYIDDPKGIDRRDKDKIANILFKKLKKAKWQTADECDCSEKYLIRIDSTGQVSNVTMIGYDTDEKINQMWDRAEFDFCINTINNALSKLKFDVIKNRGIPIPEDIYIEIWVTDKGKLENWTF